MIKNPLATHGSLFLAGKFVRRSNLSEAARCDLCR